MKPQVNDTIRLLNRNGTGVIKAIERGFVNHHGNKVAYLKPLYIVEFEGRTLRLFADEFKLVPKQSGVL